MQAYSDSILHPEPLLRIVEESFKAQVKPLITSTFPLEKVAEAFKLLDEDPDQLKVVLKP